MQRWTILLVLTLARITMGVQFQSIAALAPQLSVQWGLGFAAIGTLMGVYLLPGTITALFGGWAGHKIGDFRTALLGLSLMALGGFAGAYFTAFETQLAARFVAGIGAVALNVMLSKMAGDWFQGRKDLPIAMGILVSSWPAGLALAMLALPYLSHEYSLAQLLALPALLSFIALVSLFATWRSPFEKPTASVQNATRVKMTRIEVSLIAFSGLIWALYNVAFIGAITWSTGKIEATGATALSASAAGSLIGWAAIFSVACGGWFARSLPRPDGAALGCFALSAMAISVFAFGGQFVAHPLFLILIGILIGPAAAMIMTLPIESTRPAVRALGMGIYMAMYYAFMGLAPPLFGILRDRTQSAEAPILVSAAIMAICFGLWLMFRKTQSAFSKET